MKYKNVAYFKWVRKKAEARKTGGGPPPPPPPLTEAEEMALSQNSGRSSLDPATPQDTRAYIKVTDGVIRLLEPSAITDLRDDDEDTLSAATEREDAERPVESNAGNCNEEGPSTSTAQLTSEQINKCNLEMEHIRLQIIKTKMEMQLLDHQVGDVPTGG
ncbi:hypothetical protein N1851_022545 [Merluccius polli]|uniref:Uncharacterized protein n=1 Tax=Merluccius polli TaxID=89951 RepID=A0AA47MI19_MERPO|nr:hypothetical protein N1851_022545 [Merluccius polli]